MEDTLSSRCECYGGFDSADCSVCPFPLNGGPERGGECADRGSDGNRVVLNGEIICQANSTCNGHGECLGTIDSKICQCDDAFVGAACDSCEIAVRSSDCRNTCTWNETCYGAGRCTGNGECECYGESAGVWCQECPAGKYVEAVGLRWKEMPSVKGSVDSEISNAALAVALETKLEFTRKEFQGFAVSDLSFDNYIKVGTKYFAPADEVCVTRCSWNSSCSGHGRCRGDGLCSCFEGWIGPACDSCAPGLFGSECSKTCSDEIHCSGHGRCGAGGECICDATFGGTTCVSCFDAYGLESCDAECSADESCGGSGRCESDGSCSCFPIFNCSRVRNSLVTALLHMTDGSGSGSGSGNSGHIIVADQDFNSSLTLESVCGSEPVQNECLESCSGEGLQTCQNSFDECVVSHQLQRAHAPSLCECLGRLRMCTVDVGCEILSDTAVLGFCSTLQCSHSQCQLFYPQPTRCDWDTHALCNHDLATCLAAPESTIIFGNDCGYGRGSKCGEAYAIEEARYASRCECYRHHSEIFQFSLPDTCVERQSGLSELQSLGVGWLHETRGLGKSWPPIMPVRSPEVERDDNQTFIETPAPFIAPQTYNYIDRACLSACTGPSQQAARVQLLAYDCAVCGDGDWMLGREECEDGNRVELDGCDYECKIEKPNPVNTTSIKSSPASTPGQVLIVWNHTDVALKAYLLDLIWKVHYYSVKVNRTICEKIDPYTEECKTSLYEDVIPYEDCFSLHCEYLLPEAISGEYLEINVTGVNSAGHGIGSIQKMRWVYLPFEDVNLRELEIDRPTGSDPMRGNQVQLQWDAPSDTGYGDNESIPVLGYSIEVASCNDFRQGDDLCFYGREYLVPENSSDPILDDNGELRFSYPMKFNVEFDLHPGFFYYYRVAPFTFFGRSILIQSIRAQFGEIAVEKPMTTYPIRFPIPLAVTSDRIQVWSDSGVADEEVIQVVGFPLVRNVKDDLSITFKPVDFFGGGDSGDELLQISSTSLTEGTEFRFQPRRLALDKVESCGECSLRITVTFRRWVQKTITFTVRYFTYPDAQLLSLFPTSGPLTGGSVIKVAVRDFEGPQTRVGAGLEGFAQIKSAMDFEGSANVFFKVENQQVAGSVVKFTPGVLEGNARNFELEIMTPADPSGQGTVSQLTFDMQGTTIPIMTTFASLQFEFVGTKILESLPSTGFLNPGSGGMDVLLKISNLPTISKLIVLFAGSLCEIRQIGSPSPSDLGTVTPISVHVPELPYDYLGEVSVIVNAEGLAKSLKSTWTYLRPPAPVFDVESVVFADNPGLWVPAGAKGFDGFFVIQNLNAKFGLDYDRLEVHFGAYNGSVVSVKEIGSDAHIQVRTPNRMEAGFYITNVTAFIGEDEYTVEYGNDGLLFEIEFRDLTDPRIVASAPTEGPVRGGTIIVLGILSYSSLLQAQEISASLAFGNNASGTTVIEKPVLGVLSLYDWMERTGDYERITNLPAISSFMLGVNSGLQDQYVETVDKTIAAVDQVALNVQQGRKEAVLAFVQTPGFAQAAEAELSIRHGPYWNVSVKTSFVYIAAPQGRAVVSASTDEGILRSGMSGGIRLSVVMTNFDILYKASDIKLVFGESELDVSRLLYSTQESTEFFIVVPPNTPKVITVSVSPVLFPSNWAQFDFEYYDDVVPEVTSYGPYQAYEDGGIEMEIKIILFPEVTASQITISIRSGIQLIGTATASRVTYELGTATVNFQLPPGPVGEATMSVNAASKATEAVIFKYVSIPRTPPSVLRVWPTIGSSNGGDVMEITLQNFKQVQSINEVFMVMRFQAYTFDLEGNQVIETVSVTPEKKMMKLKSSTLTATKFSITMPRVPETAASMRSNARIWGARNASLFAEYVIDYRDDNLATVLWMIPKSERSDRDALVELSIAKFGSVKPDDGPGLYLGMLSHSGDFSHLDSTYPGSSTTALSTTPPPNSMNGTMMTTPEPFEPVSLVSLSQTTSPDGSVNTNVKFILRSRGNVPGVATLAFANCQELGACDKKTIRFQFNFRDPDAAYAQSFAPVSSFTDGRVPLSIYVENLPFSVTVADILVELSSNVTVTSITREEPSGPKSKNARLDCMIPSALGSKSLTPSIRVRKLGLLLPFPTEFTYKSSPNPVTLSVLPSRAPMLTSATIRVRIQNFPGVKTTSEIVVQFRWSDGTTAPGTVKSFDRINPTLPPLAVQDISMQMETPFGVGTVREGVATLTIYHEQYRLRPSTFNGFNFIDTTGPAVSGISTNAQTFGSQRVEVRLSMATEVTVSVQNAKVAVVSTQVDGKDISLLTSQHNADTRSAKIVFSAAKADTLRSIYGLLMFAKETVSCTSSCCASSTCSTNCKGKTACFQLQYFDDLAPKVVTMSGTAGTELGGTLVEILIAKFPKVPATQGESSKVAALFGDRYPGRVFVTYSSEEETALAIETPEIDMEGNAVKTVDLVLTPLDRPDREMRFQYQVSEVAPKVISIFPSTGGSPGGVQVRVKIEFFPFGGDAGVEFGELALATDQVQISSKSTKQLSEIIFTTPKTDIGLTTVNIYPKSCPNCGKTVSVMFDQLDTSIPVLVQPIPVAGAMQEIPGQINFLKFSNFPVTYETVELNFKGEGIDVEGKVLSVSVDAALMASIVFTPPTSPRVGMSVLTITVNTLYQERRSAKKVTTPYSFFDATALRTLSTLPASFPSRLSLFGQTIDFVQPTSLKLSNFPQGIAISELSIMLGSVPIKVVSVKDTETCFPPLIDCNRTEIFIQSPPQDFAGNADLALSVNEGAPFMVTLPYFQPCDYENFCSKQKKIAARQLLIQRPPTDTKCEASYCVDLKDVPEPSIMSVVPTEGPTSGGTEVRIDFKNFPAFVSSEVQVTVGEGGNTVYGKVNSLQNLGGTLVRSEGYLTIQTPSVPNAVDVRTEVLKIQVSFGGLTKTIESGFRYTPVIIGNPVISKISRRGSVEASLFPKTSNHIIVQLTNFPFMKDLNSKSKVKAVFEGQTYDASTIMASSYASTVVGFTLAPQGTSGEKDFSIYYAPFGAQRAATVFLTVLPPPTPSVDGFFPLQGKAGRNLIVGITIKFLDHTLTEGDFLTLTRVTMQAPGASIASDMPVSNVLVLTPATCMSQECSKVTINCELEGGLVPKAGGDVLVRLSFGTETVELTVPFEADNTPELKNLDPKTMNVDQIDTTVLKVYGSNMKPRFCSKSVDCSVSFDFSKFVLVDRVRTGIVQDVRYDAGEHVFEVKVPKIGQAGMARVTITSESVSLAFDYEITMPGTDLLPIDSTCSGFETLTMKVRGWGSSVKFVSEIQVHAGSQALQVQSISSSVADRENTFSETVFKVSSPKSSRLGDLIGVVSLNGKMSSTFRLECYAQPRARLTPAEATLDGRTLSVDGSSILIFLENFPPIQTATDISVQFGTIVCDGSQCVVLGYRNGVKGTTVQVSVPSVTEVKNVPVQVTYRGAVAPPAGGDPSKTYVRSTKTASADFQYFIPAPKVVLTDFCIECNEGDSCLKNGVCRDGAEPRQSAMAMSAKGRMTVIVDNFPQISFDRTTGQVNAPAEVSITFGSNFGVVSRVLFSDKTRSAFEVALETQIEKSTLTAELQVYPDVSNPTSFSATFPVQVYDDTVSMECYGFDHCEGKHVDGDPFVVTVINYAIPQSLVEGILVKFDQISADMVESLDSTMGRSRLQLTPPSFDCSSCVTENGFATVTLSIILRSTDELIVSSSYTFWAPPKLADCRFSSVGTSLLLTFDQQTNRAGMDDGRDCSLLLSESTVMQLGMNPECIWTSDSSLTVVLGLQPTIAPGDTLHVRAGGQSNLKGINLISAHSETSRTIGAPAVAIPPYVELKAKDVIDPCSSLEMRATAFSPRPPLYTWGCENDEVLNGYLSTQTGDTIYLAPGTPSMPILDKTYKVTLVVTDFMGSTSPVLYLSIFKKSAATPQIQFTPPFLTVTRNDEVEINGEAVFSDCPTEKVDMIFRWQQVFGPPISTEYLMVAIPQLEIPKNTLEPGATYRFSLQASMTGAASQVMEGIFELKTAYQELKPIIANGTSLKVSSFNSFQLSAEGSYDPDCPIAGLDDRDLRYSWRCYYTLRGIQSDCRDSSTNNKLLLSSTRDIQIRQGVLVPAPFPFIFELTVSKKGRSPVSRSISVDVVDQILPKVGLTYEGGVLTPDGLVALNLQDRIIIRGFCDDPNNVKYAWSVTPFVNLTNPSIAPLGSKTVDLVLQPNPEVFTPGNRYMISFGATTRIGATSETKITIVVNSPPRGGTFSVCLLNLADASSCIKTGIAVTDEFRVYSSGWADDDVPLLYNYGYETQPDPVTGNITTLWFDPVKDNVRDMGFPKGSLTVMAHVIDSLGGKTAMLKDSITVVDSESPQAGRRLLAAMSFLERAKAKLKESLSAFRADKVNQMAGSMSSMGGGADMGGNIMNALVSGTGRASRTNGRACEAMGSAAAVSSKPANVGASAVGGMAGMLKAMLKTKLGAMSGQCAGSAASATSGSLKAQAMHKRANPNQPSMLTPAQASDFVTSLEAGMKEVVRKTALDFVPGEPPKKITSEGSEHVISRAASTTLNGAVMSQPLPSMFSSTMVASITTPDTFSDEVFGPGESPLVDIHVASHGLAPDMPGWSLKSPMVGLTVSRAQASSEVKVQNLSKPISIFIPVDLSGLNEVQLMLFPQQARCVFWDANVSTYNTTGCNVTAASTTSVTCSCNHLTLFAVSVDTSAGACGDGVIQPDEQCDDRNVMNRDGCSAKCVIEELCECKEEPSICFCRRKKGAGTPNADGVRATLAITGFKSVDDWLHTEVSFKQTVADLVAQGVSKLDVVTIQVCHGSDCEVFWEEGSYRRDLPSEGMPERATGFSVLGDHNQSTSGRRLLTTTTDVTFQVNVPPDSDTSNAEIYAAIAFPSFLSRFTTSYGTKIGRPVTATFLVQPGLVTEQEGELWNKPGAGYRPDAAKPNETAPVAFIDSLKRQSGLSIGVLFGIAFSALAFVLVVTIYFVIIPRYKRSIEKRERAKIDADNLIAKKRAIHPLVDIPHALGLAEGDSQETDDDENDAGEAGQEEGDGRQRRRPPRVGDHHHHVHEHVHDVIDNNSDVSDLSDDDPGVLPGGATESQKFGYAKRRLQQLQDQLDSILHENSESLSVSESQPFEPSSTLAESQPDSFAPHRSGRLPPLIMGMGGGKAKQVVTASTNFEAQALLRPDTASSSASGATHEHARNAAMDAGWGHPSKDEEIVKGADGRKMRVAAPAPESGLQPVPPPARRPPQFNDAGARAPGSGVIRRGPVLKDQG